MKKFWLIYSGLFLSLARQVQYFNKEEAIREMLLLKSETKRDYYLLESIIYTGSPPPQIER
jgi:hypothetical protein